MKTEIMCVIGGLLSGIGIIVGAVGLWLVCTAELKRFDWVITALCGIAFILGVIVLAMTPMRPTQ